METTTALLLFALLAFLVERLTNGIAMILEYFSFWGKYFGFISGAEASLNNRNHRNKRIFLFLLGIAIAVPMCMYFGFNIIGQLQLPQMQPWAEQAGTGLLAATGADPIREIVYRTDTGDTRFGSFRTGGGSGGGDGGRVIQVEARLVAPPGTVLHFNEARTEPASDPRGTTRESDTAEMQGGDNRSVRESGDGPSAEADGRDPDDIPPVKA